MTDTTPQNPLSKFTPRRVLLPVVIGLAVSVYLVVVVSKIDASKLSQIPFSRHLVYGLLLAVLTVILRDLAYMYRINCYIKIFDGFFNSYSFGFYLKN